MAVVACGEIFSTCSEDVLSLYDSPRGLVMLATRPGLVCSGHGSPQALPERIRKTKARGNTDRKSREFISS